MKKDFKVGDKVFTTKGCRIKGCTDTLVVKEINKYWAEYPAVMCKKEDGSTRMFLVHNLQKIKKRKKI